MYPYIGISLASEAQVPGHVVAPEASRPKLMTTFGRTWPGGMPQENRMNEASTGKPV